MNQYTTFRAIIIVLIIVLFSSCSKSGSNPAPINSIKPADPPTISSLSATEGDYNSSIVITGANFSTTIGDNQVFFNEKAATITAATTTQLTVTVPKDSGTGSVTVKVNNKTATGPVFTYLGILAIDSISINHGAYKYAVTIHGTGFSANSANNRVFFNGKVATLYASSTTKLVAIVPLAAGTGNISISINNGSPLSGQVFTYELSYVSILLAGSDQGQAGVLNGKGTAALLTDNNGIAIDKLGNTYVPETGSQLIREITSQGVVSSYAGLALDPVSNGTVAPITLYYPLAVAVDASNNLYVADGLRNWIQKITPAGIVTVLAGSGAIGSDNGSGNVASFNFPTGLAVDPSGNVFVSDESNNQIRKITPSGLATTFAGNILAGKADGTGISATFNLPDAIAIDTKGDLYVADGGNNAIRKITPAGVVTTLATNAFAVCTGLAVDDTGNIYIVNSSGNGEIDKFAPNGTKSVLIQQLVGRPTGIVLDKNNNIFFTLSNAVYQLTYQ